MQKVANFFSGRPALEISIILSLIEIYIEIILPCKVCPHPDNVPADLLVLAGEDVKVGEESEEVLHVVPVGDPHLVLGVEAEEATEDVEDPLEEGFGDKVGHGD